MPVTDTATRLTGLADEDLIALHERLDRQGAVDSAVIEAHHLAATELLKRGLTHGHTDDEWVEAVILVEKALVSSADEIEAPDGFEKAWGESLAHGGSVSVLLTTDGYVLKADPTVSDVHQDTIMGGGRKKPRRIMPPADMEKTIREEGGKFVVYSEDLKRKFGTYDTRTEAEERLRQIERFSKADDYAVPRAVQSAAKQALKWIADGKAGGGFTSVGRNRARQLADGGTVSRATLVKMRAYFARHIVDKDAKGWGDKSKPTPGMVAWYAWGGDPGRAWANRVLGDVEKAYDPEDSLTDKEKALYAAYEAVAGQYGEFTPAEAHYMGGDDNPWNAQGMNCANCVFFEGGGGCEILTEQVEPEGLCKLWVIPQGLMRHDAPAEKAVEALAKFTLPGGATYEFSVPVSAVGPLTAVPDVSVAKHQQGKHDQAAHGRRGGVSVSPEVAQSIIGRVREQGGLSVNMIDGSEPPDGYMVARTEGVKPSIVSADEFYGADTGPAALSSFLKDNKASLTGGDYLGVWHDTDSGNVFLDVSQNVKDRATAERLGSERNQISIWDVVEGKEIATGGTGEIAKADSGGEVAGSVDDDGRGDRRVRSESVGADQSTVVKHGEPGRDKNYHRKHPHGRGGPGGKGETEGKVYRTRDHKRAISMLARGEKVILESDKDVNTFLEKLHDYASDAREKGEDAGNLDLCRVSVPGTNLFCTESLGVPRIEMPQLAGKPVKGSAADKMPKDKNGEVNVGELFREKLEAKGVDVRDTEVPAASLKASQNELKGANVAFMMSPNGQKVVNLEDTRIFVSSDGYVIDGHHRWAANVGLDSSDGKLGDKKMKVTMIDMPISEVLAEANTFADDIGIAPKAAKSVDGQMEKHKAGKGHDQKSHGAWAKGGGEQYGGYELIEPDNPPAESKRGADSIAAAKAMRAKVAEVEPQITRDMIDAANKHKATMVGLNHRMKSEKSLARKIDDEKDLDFGGDAERAAANMNDVARYTMEYDGGDYVSGAEGVISDLEGQGYALEVKNYWADNDPYQGINIAAVHPNGTRFELQFHTPESSAVKGKIHERYQKYRESDDPRTRYKEYDGMRRTAEDVPVPEPREALMAIGELKTQPFTPRPDAPPVEI